MEKKKNVFAVINCSEENSKEVASYAASFAKMMGLDLVLYPHLAKKDFDIRPAYLAARNAMKRDMVRVSKGKINVFSFLTSLHDLAKKENAAFIVMTMEEEANKMVWKTVEKTSIPILLVPSGMNFVPFDSITIAIDRTRKMQKLNFIRQFHEKNPVSVNILQERVSDDDTNLINTTNHILRFLKKHRIPVTIETARKRENYAKHLCKFSSKRGNLLILELDRGNVDKQSKKQVNTLLSVEIYAQPVLILKTRHLGILLPIIG